MTTREILLKSIIDELYLYSADELITIREEWQQEMANRKASKAVEDFVNRLCGLVIEEKRSAV